MILLGPPSIQIYNLFKHERRKYKGGEGRGSEVNTIVDVLEEVVEVREEGGRAREALSHDLGSELGRIGLAPLGTEATPEVGEGDLLEAWQLCGEHEVHDGDDGVHVLTHGKEGLHA